MVETKLRTLRAEEVIRESHLDRVQLYWALLCCGAALHQGQNQESHLLASFRVLILLLVLCVDSGPFHEESCIQTVRHAPNAVI